VVVRERPFESEEAFESLYRAHASDVFAFCLRRALPSAAEDALAETFAVAWRRRRDIPEHPVPWLLGVSRRVLANQRRTWRRIEALEKRLSLERPIPGGAETADPAVLSALAALPAKDQEVLLLAAWDELTSRDAGRVVGCSATAYRLRLLRARRRFARSLESVDGSISSAARAWRTSLEMKEMQS
jgi:DNA-directed RNA polymerase specialized sigma24 family protein